MNNGFGGVNADSGTEKNKSCGGQKGVEQNASENDGYGKTVVAKAQSNVKHHAQTPFTEHFLKGTKTAQCPDAAPNDAIPVATTFRADFTSSVTEGMSSHTFICEDEVRVSFVTPALMKRGNSA